MSSRLVNPPKGTAGNSAITFQHVLILLTRDKAQVSNILNVNGTVVQNAPATAGLIGSNKPTTIESLLGHLGSSNVAAIKSLTKYGDTSYTNASHSEFIEMLKNCKGLMDYLADNKITAGPSAPSLPALQVNNAGLHLLLANPMVAKVVMEQRKKQAAASLVRAVAVPSGIFGIPGGPGINISIHGGAMPELDSNIPIEMRGAGYALAAMRGGSIGGNIIFGTQGTTMWRPIDDNSFISQSLELAIDNLKSQLNSNGASLDVNTEKKIRDSIIELKAKEEEVKKYRDQISSMNSALAVGNAKPTGSVDLKNIEATAEAYNNAMKSRQKLEGKLLRVVVALGGKVAAVGL